MVLALTDAIQTSAYKKSSILSQTPPRSLPVTDMNNMVPAMDAPNTQNAIVNAKVTQYVTLSRFRVGQEVIRERTLCAASTMASGCLVGEILSN
jgi:hypothetical protein